MTREEYINKLVEISLNKEKMMEDFKKFTILQRECIEKDDLDKTEIIIKKKQKRIELINKLDDEFEKYFEQFKDNYKFNDISELISSNKPELKKLKEVISRIVKLLRSANEIDIENKNIMKDLRMTYKGQIRKFNANKKINKAYNVNQTSKPPSYFIDKKK